ncbi:MAG TPA: hypothetical protein VJ372_14205 [Pyrinomonadaceae bacterium]|jgi:hypothetical protein|nr:hypothetical protein [Pyrinomonadaceae bacterium]
MILDQTIERKLTRVYVALAMTREVARRDVVHNETSNSILLLIDVASGILEELLETSDMSFRIPTSPLELEMLM